MKARNPIANGAFGPEQLKVMGQAFDEAWKQIAPQVGICAETIEANRLRLAGIILEAARHGASDPGYLRDTGVQAMLRDLTPFTVQNVVSGLGCPGQETVQAAHSHAARGRRPAFSG